jgi:hypothetical protein
VDACMLEAMYKQGLLPDVRHGGPFCAVLHCAQVLSQVD